MKRRGNLGSLRFSRSAQKRGQLTIFILVAVVLVLVIIGIFFMFRYIRSSSMSDAFWQSDSQRRNVEYVRDYISDCVDSTTKEALIVVAFQGGYSNPPMRVFSYSPVFFPYYYYEGQIHLPGVSRIESELGEFVSDSMYDCLSEGRFTNIDLRFSSGVTDVRLSKDNAFFEVNLPVELRSEGYSMTIDLRDFRVNHNSSLFEIYEVAEYITETHNEDSEYYCMNCVSEMLYERDLYMYTFPTIVEDVTGIMIYENRTGIGNPYSFIFFNKYTGDERTPKLSV